MKNKIPCINPSTLEILEEVEIPDRKKILSSLEKTRKAQKIWSTLPLKQRIAALSLLKDTIIEKTGDIAKVISQETGNPLLEIITEEIIPLLYLLEFFIKQTQKKLNKKRIKLSTFSEGIQRCYVDYEPAGVIGIIASLNAPFLIPVINIIKAIITGNSVIFKPSEFTTLVGFKIGQLFELAEFPKDLVSVIPGNEETENILISSGLDRVIFAGNFFQAEGTSEKKIKFVNSSDSNLPHHTVMVILKDADIKKAAKSAVWGAFRGSGEVYGAVKKIYVEESIYQKFLQSIVEETKTLRVGQSLYGEVEIGSVVTEPILRGAEDGVEETIKKGGSCLTGGRRLNIGGLFFKPTVIADVKDEIKGNEEYVSGPVVLISKFQKIEEIINRINKSNLKFTLCFWSSNRRKSLKMSKMFKANTIILNNVFSFLSFPELLINKISENKNIQIYSNLNLFDMVNSRYVLSKKQTFLQRLSQFPYSSEKINLLKIYIKARFCSSFAVRLKNRFMLMARIIKRH